MVYTYKLCGNQHNPLQEKHLRSSFPEFPFGKEHRYLQPRHGTNNEDLGDVRKAAERKLKSQNQNSTTCFAFCVFSQHQSCSFFPFGVLLKYASQGFLCHRGAPSEAAGYPQSPPASSASFVTQTCFPAQNSRGQQVWVRLLGV